MEEFTKSLGATFAQKKDNLSKALYPHGDWVVNQTTEIFQSCFNQYMESIDLAIKSEEITQTRIIELILIRDNLLQEIYDLTISLYTSNSQLLQNNSTSSSSSRAYYPSEKMELQIFYNEFNTRRSAFLKRANQEFSKKIQYFNPEVVEQLQNDWEILQIQEMDNFNILQTTYESADLLTKKHFYELYAKQWIASFNNFIDQIPTLNIYISPENEEGYSIIDTEAYLNEEAVPSASLEILNSQQAVGSNNSTDFIGFTQEEIELHHAIELSLELVTSPFENI